MSEFEYEDGGGFDPAAVDDQPEFRVDRDEWEATQAQLAQVSELVDAVESQSRQEQEAQAQAEWEDYLGDPLDDPAGYGERLLERARLDSAAVAASGVAPFREAYDLAVLEQESAAADELASDLLTNAALERGLELTPDDAEQARVEIAAELEKVQVEWATEMLTQSHLRYGLPVDEQATVAALQAARARLMDERTSDQTAHTAIKWWADRRANEERKRGDETNLVGAYFADTRASVVRPAYKPAPVRQSSRSADAPQYQDDAHRQLSEQVLRRS
jgi:hypothetical protein